jgi:DNA mismatch endonuclease, patch repair protein
MDIVDQPTRSRMMAGIRSQDTAPELFVRRFLHACGLRYTLHKRDLPGRPDIVLPRHRTVVFVHGCFWHRHSDCRFATVPTTRAEFWQRKFTANVARDASIEARLIALGWHVLTVWECQLQDELALEAIFWNIVAHDS